jgi:hypothetical protein
MFNPEKEVTNSSFISSASSSSTVLDRQDFQSVVDAMIPPNFDTSFLSETVSSPPLYQFEQPSPLTICAPMEPVQLTKGNIAVQAYGTLKAFLEHAHCSILLSQLEEEQVELVQLVDHYKFIASEMKFHLGHRVKLQHSIDQL